MQQEMGHDKLDQKINKALSNRKIQPSASSWDKLELMLEKEEQPKKKKRGFYYVAASLILLLTLSLLLKNNEVVSEDNIVDELKTIEIIKGKDLIIDTPQSKNKEEVVEEVQIDKTNIDNQSKTKRHNNCELKNNVVQSNKIKENKISKISLANDKEMPLKENNSFVNVEEQEVISDKLNIDLMTLDDEVESLLAEAQTQLTKEKELEEKKSTKPQQSVTSFRVNPDDLLSEVEEVAEESFRAKVFEKVKLGFKKSKTTVATRND